MQRYILFLFVLLCGGLVEAQSNYRCEYWFDNDHAERVSAGFSGETFYAECDAAHLPMGFHTLTLRVNNSAEWSAPSSFTFFKLRGLAEADSLLTYRYWFDEQYEASQTGNVGNDMLWLDADSLETGLHTLNVAVMAGSALRALRSYTFLKVQDVADLEGNLTYTCWFNDDFASAQSGSLGNGTIMLATDDLSVGLHTLQVVIDAGQPQTSIRSYLFLKANHALVDTANGDSLVYSYWFDDNDAHKRTGRLHNGTLLIDTDSLLAGLHYINFQISNATRHFVQRELFYKKPGIGKYEYWVNDDFDHRAAVNVTPPQMLFVTDTLLFVDTAAFDVQSFAFQPRTPNPVVYAKNDIHFRFWNTANRWNDTIASYIDERVYRDVIADTIERNSSESIATPTGNHIHWFVLDAGVGDSLAFKADHSSELTLYSPLGEKIMSVSGDSVISWTGLRANENGYYHLAVFNGSANYANLNVSYYYDMQEVYTELSASICEGNTYTENGFNVDEAGVYTQTLQTAQGADSIVTLVLTVLPTAETWLYDTLCQGESYLQNGFAVTNAEASQTYEQEFATTQGCDSTVILGLTVHETYHTQLYAGVVQGGSYTENGFNILNVQRDSSYTIELQSRYSCDSMVTLHLTMYSDEETYLEAAICAGDSYTENGFNLTNQQASGIHTLNLQTTHGSDSTVHLNLTVHPNKTTALQAVLCQGDSYTANGFTITNIQTNSTQVQQLTTTQGCDSTVTLQLTVNPTYQHSDAVTLCDDMLPYSYGNSVLTAAGVHSVEFASVNGCDSVISLALTVNPTYRHNDAVTLCDDMLPYSYGDSVLTAAGVHGIEFASVDGCDSVVNLALTVNPTYHHNNAVTLCDNMLPYSYGGSTLTTAGVHNIEFASVDNCDSVVALNLMVKPTYRHNDAVALCDNMLPYSYGDSVLTAAGVHNIAFTAGNGCDSTIMLGLTVNETYHTELYAGVVQGGSYNQQGFAITDVQGDSSYTQQLQSHYGCDSTVTLHVTMYSDEETYLEAAICAGDSYTANGFNLLNQQSSGIHSLNLQTAHGSDSIVRLNLTVHPNKTTPLQAVLCQGDSYNANGFSMTNVQTNSTQVQQLSTTEGCDSTVTLQLTVHATYQQTDAMTLCDNMLPYSYGDSTLTTAGLHSIGFSSVNGCDSTVVVTLTVNASYQQTDTLTVCDNMLPYSYGDSLLNAAGVHRIDFSSMNGCDSVISLSLSVNTSYQQTASLSVCDNMLTYSYGDSLLTTAGVHTIGFTAVNGCDSTVLLAMSVKPTYQRSSAATVCDNMLPYSYSDSLLSAAGVYTFVYPASNGCDSTDVLTLTVNPTYQHTDAVTVCDNMLPYSYGDTLLSEAGWHTVGLTSIHNCDSTITLALTTNPSAETVLYDVVCQGSDYANYGFSLTDVQESDTLTLSLSTVNGCDSTVTLCLAVNPSAETVLYDVVCQGSDYANYGFSLTDVQENDTLTLSLNTENGCDSTVTLYLTVNATAETLLYDTICQGNDYADYGFSLTDVQENDTLTLSLSTVNGCDSTVTLLLTVMPTYSIVIDDTVARGESYTEHGFELSDLQESGTYTQELTTRYGCDSVITLNLTVQEVGIETVENGEEIAVVLYPNPADKHVSLQVEALPSEATITLYDAQGRTVLTETLQAGQELLRLNIQHLAAGSYHVRIVANNKTVVRKLMVR